MLRRSCERVCAVLVVSVDGIEAYFKKQVGPASLTLADEDQLQKLISNEDASVVGECLISYSFHIWIEDLFFVVRTTYLVLFFSQDSLPTTRAPHRLSFWRRPVRSGTNTVLLTPTLRPSSRARTSKQSEEICRSVQQIHQRIFFSHLSVVCLQRNCSLPPTTAQKQVWRQQREIHRGQIHQQQNQKVYPGQHVRAKPQAGDSDIY